MAMVLVLIGCAAVVWAFLAPPTPSQVSLYPFDRDSDRASRATDREVDLGRCGTWEFSFSLPAEVFAGEPFSVKLIGLSSSPVDRNCNFTSNLDFVTRSTVAMSPSGPVQIQTPRSGGSLSFEYSASTAQPGVLGIGAVIFGGDVATPGTLRTSLEVRPSRRVADAERWLTKAVSNTTVRATGDASTFRKGRRAVLTLDVTTTTDPLPPGMTSGGTLDVCVDVAGGAGAPQSCTTTSIAFDRDMRESRKLVVEITGSDKISVLASISLTASVDGQAIGGFSEFRSTTTDFRPTVAAVDRLSQGSRVAVGIVAALGGAGGLAILVAAIRPVVLRARRYTRRRVVESDKESARGYI